MCQFPLKILCRDFYVPSYSQQMMRMDIGRGKIHTSIFTGTECCSNHFIVWGKKDKGKFLFLGSFHLCKKLSSVTSSNRLKC